MEIWSMKSLLLTAAASLVLFAGFGSTVQAHPFAPADACGPHNQGAVTATENMDPYGNGVRFVFTCYSEGWVLTETWYCGDNGWYYSCTVM
ncbi:MAG: hypothetical protein ABS96_14065 [Lysobacteraceae bacterium SCN 69-123]|nr:MAG: hypothetical protein ABS96_14065 [Xanthomonadaceae bacterium SCN 69-123]